MEHKLLQFLDKLNKEALIGIMWEALSMMQSYNGQTITYCLVIAMGGKAEEKDNGGYLYKLPTIAKANEYGKNSPLF